MAVRHSSTHTDIDLAIQNSLLPQHQSGLLAQALTLQAEVGSDKMLLHTEGSQGDCGPVACCAIIQHLHPSLHSDCISPTRIRQRLSLLVGQVQVLGALLRVIIIIIIRVWDLPDELSSTFHL